MSPATFDKKALIRYRMERALETLHTARLLSEQEADPASIVNRAYYAMFYSALALLLTAGQETSKHSGALALFDKHFIKTGILPKEMSRFFHSAFDMRMTGDYQDHVELTRQDALQVLESAAQFVNSIEEKLSNQP